MKLFKLLTEAGIVPDCEIKDEEITEIVTDSRKACLGCMFICLSGGRSDGHRYILEAMLRGAVAVVVQTGTEIPVPEHCPYVNIIGCENTRRAAAMLYSAWYGHPSRRMKVIGVTGTNGKTTVTHMLRSVFEAALYKCGVIGTVYCSSGDRQIFAQPGDPLANMTTPDPRELYRLLAYMAADKVDYVFMEVSSHALALCKVDAITFDSAVFTNLSPEHLDFHGDMENYALSKAKLFSLAERSVINSDDGHANLMEKASAGRVYRYSAGKNRDRPADFYAENIVNSRAGGINYTLRSKNTIMKVKSPIPGAFNVDNTLCAAACGLLHGIAPSVICEAMGVMRGVEGRMERVRLCGHADFSVFVDYAHTPDALENLLITAGELKGEEGRIVLVFGCGGDRDRSKRPQMGSIASKYADLAVITSDNSRSEDPLEIISQIESGLLPDGCPHLSIESRREAIEYVIKNARSGDVILLAGKGHEKYEIDRFGRHELDEKKIAAEMAEKYHSGKK